MSVFCLLRLLKMASGEAARSEHPEEVQTELRSNRSLRSDASGWVLCLQ
jgi:hypothetical protein